MKGRVITFEETAPPGKATIASSTRQPRAASRSCSAAAWRARSGGASSPTAAGTGARAESRTVKPR